MFFVYFDDKLQGSFFLDSIKLVEFYFDEKFFIDKLGSYVRNF